MGDRPPRVAGRWAGERAYRTGVDVRLKVAKKLAHADVAHFMVACARDPAVVRTIQDIGH